MLMVAASPSKDTDWKTGLKKETKQCFYKKPPYR
jgi:hypothetical protein